jgi:hypothetical protein
MGALPPLRIVATYYDNYWHRQHFKGYDRSSHYCTVEVNRGEFQIHTFCGEPECPIREDVEIIEVTNQGEYVKHWQEVAKEAGNGN